MIFVTGDIHGEFERFSDKQYKKLKKSDTLIVLGDFGFFFEKDEKQRNKTLKKLSKLPFKILFIDGLSENFEVLYSFPDAEYCGAKAKEICKDKIYYIRRGEIMDLEGHRILFFGGSDVYDPDIYIPADMPTRQEFENCTNRLSFCNYSVDYILTHIPRGEISRFINLTSLTTSETMDYFDRIGKLLTYKKWYFGSVHQDKYVSPLAQAVYTDVRVLGE